MLTPTLSPVRKWKPEPHMVSPLGALETLSTVARFARGEPIYRNGDPAEYWYRIVAGASRKCAFTFDGSRQIVDFLRSGDLFGYDAHETHSFAVEAIVSGTVVARYSKQCAERLADSDPVIARQIRELAFESVGRGQSRMVILGQATALGKVGGFLLEMADRFSTASGSPVTLPMSRYDIADYLAMAVETVSRALTILRERQVIQFEGVRCVRICDRESLKNASESNSSESITGRLSLGDRGTVAQPAHARVAVIASSLS
jgi:CRP/FNR family transcriptional regulator, nitrogen fixation regulation protein